MPPRNSPLIVCLGAAAASLGACASMPEPTPTVTSMIDRHRIEVEQAGARLEIDAASGALTDKARADIADFAGAYLRFGHGALILSTPNGAANASAAANVARQARVALMESGVNPAAIADSGRDASADSAAPVVLSFTHFEAQAPECAPLWTQDLAHQSNNQPWASFGCATQANLAALVEDPHDLLHPRNMDPRDSGRRDTVMEAYRDGHTTTADRTPDERVTISNVAN